MKVKCFAVYDAAAAVYGAPFVAVNKATATRSFRALANDGQSAVSVSPKDYTLHLIGEYDDQDGRLESCPPEYIASAQALKDSD